MTSEVPARAALEEHELEQLEVIAAALRTTPAALIEQYIADGIAREFLCDQRASEVRLIH